MLEFIIRRILWTIPILFLVSLLAFAIIQAPPGDFVTALSASLAERGEEVDMAQLEALRTRFGLDKPFIVQYWKWISGVLVGDFGVSFEWRQPVSELIGERLGLSFILALATILFTWALALPIGIYSAVKKYTIGDYIVTTIGFIGLAMPNFLLALVLMYVGVVHLGNDVTGLFSPEYRNAPWSIAKCLDLLAHLWIPVVILGTSATASIIRIMRANLLDELPKPYVTTARAKGLSEFKVLVTYPVRVALSPFISTIGWMFPQIISGSVIVSIVLSLPTAGPLLLSSLKAQDMYLAGSFVLLLSILSVVGMLVSDILLAIADPRIRRKK
ncbi:ABC transporter permease [Arcticibacterium luteifluviistationis]|uniref:ABC transporter permease n=1 Tax=Arcticibacterium luteifluviistationis TaxID=1784714 RepID=A0A2Z4G7P2_9BACT|nr:ABC transporter permease [Arcticibacterium luteifluviistationis]AWV97120.1 ABC transporter permease [Arcticibacterium luteifluviistationis]